MSDYLDRRFATELHRQVINPSMPDEIRRLLGFALVSIHLRTNESYQNLLVEADSEAARTLSMIFNAVRYDELRPYPAKLEPETSSEIHNYI